MAQRDAHPGRRASGLRPLVEFLASVFWGGDPENGIGALLTRISDLGQSVSLADPGVKKAFAALLEAGRTSQQDTVRDLEAAYVALFVAAKGPVPAPLYQSCHEEGRLMGEPALAMNRRLAAAGLAVGSELSEPADHLCIELEYLYWLLDRAASGHAAALAEASGFARDVMLPWVRRFAAKIEDARGPAIFQTAAGLLLAVLDAVAALDGPEPHGLPPDHSCHPST